MPKCNDCGTTYRKMDHSVAACAEAGGAEAKRMMEPKATFATLSDDDEIEVFDTRYSFRITVTDNRDGKEILRAGGGHDELPIVVALMEDAIRGK